MENTSLQEKDHLESTTDKRSKKSYGTAVALSGIFGIFGIHHFYVGRYGMGVFDLGLSIAFYSLFWNGYRLIGIAFLIVDIIHTVYVTYKLLVGEYKDGEGKIIAYPGQKL